MGPTLDLLSFLSVLAFTCFFDDGTHELNSPPSAYMANKVSKKLMPEIDKSGNCGQKRPLP